MVVDNLIEAVSEAVQEEKSRFREVRLPSPKQMYPPKHMSFSSEDFVRSMDLEGEIMGLYKRLIVKQREGVHCSDRDFPRKALFDRMYPTEPDDKTTLKWIRGQSMHALFEALFAGRQGVEVEEETAYVRDGEEMWSTPDVLLRISKGNLPLIMPFTMEFKSVLFEVKGEPLPHQHWCNRLLDYMALTGSPVGAIVVQILWTSEIRCFVSPRVEWDIIESRRDDIFQFVRAFKHMWSKGANLFSPCPAWLCRSCPHHIVHCTKEKMI